MGEKAMKGKAITKVLSCLVVIVFLTSTFSVAVIATDSANSTASNVNLHLNDEANSSVESIALSNNITCLTCRDDLIQINKTETVVNESGNSDLPYASNTSSPGIINESDEVPDPDLPVINDTDIEDTAKTVSSMSSCSYVWIKITDKYCKGYKVYVDGKYELKEDGDGYCCFTVTPGYHTFKLTLNGKEVSNGWNCQCGHVYNWMSMNDMIPHWCEDGGNDNPTDEYEVKFQGTVTSTTPSEYDCGFMDVYICEVEIEKVVFGDYFEKGDIVNIVYSQWRENAHACGTYDKVSVGDTVEVYGEMIPIYCVGTWITICGKSSYYLKKIDSESLSIDVWTADASKNTKTEFEPGGNIYIWVKTNRPVTIDLIVDIYYDSGGHVQKYLRDDKRLSAANEYYNVWTAGEPGRRVLTLKAWDDYGNYAEDKWTFYVKGTTEQEITFTGTAIEYFSLIGAGGWYVKVDKIISGPLELQGHTVSVYLAPVDPDQYPPGYMDPNIESGDKVEVYGLYQGEDNVALFGSVDYYIKKDVEEPKTGSLTVTIYPSEVRSGAWWKLTSGPDTNWHSSGYTITNIPLDYYTIRFSDVTGWTKPSDKTVTITEGSNYESGWYTKEKENQSPTAHIVSISPNPANQGKMVSFSGYGTDPDGDSITAYNWRSSIDGQLSTSPSFSTSSLSVGAHTIYFKVKDSHNAWSDEILMSLDISSEIKFNGTFIEQNVFMGFLSYYFEVDEAPEGSVPVGDKIRVYVYTDGYPNQGTYDQLESGDRAEVYAEFEKWRGKEFDQWVDYKVWVADIRDNEKYYVEKMEEKPDLIVQDISWSPSSPKEGDNVTFSVQVKNQGLGDAKKESLLTINDSFVNSTIRSYVVHTFIIPPLCAGKTITKTDPWKDKLSLCGTHTVRAIADIGNVIDESNENNNERTETLNVPCEKPDLIITDISTAVGHVGYEIENQGTKEASGDYNRWLYINDEEIIKGSDRIKLDKGKKRKILWEWASFSSLTDITRVKVCIKYNGKKFCQEEEWSKEDVNDILNAGKSRLETIGVEDIPKNLPNVEYPIDKKLPEYVPPMDTIYVPANYTQDDFAILHEYGHFVEDKWYLLNMDSDCPSDHKLCQRSGEKCAMKEGWAHFLSCLARNTPKYFGEDDFLLPDFEHPFKYCRDKFQLSKSPENEKCEIIVAAIFWDLYDPPNEDFDEIEIPANELVALIKDSMDRNSEGLRTFYSNFNAKYEGTELPTEFDTLLSEYGIDYTTKKEKPDLVIQDISWEPKNPNKGDTVTFTAIVKNQGPESTGKATFIKYFVDGTLIDTGLVPALSGGSTSTQKFTWTANKWGDVLVKVVADYWNDVEETNEENNERTETVHIECPPKEKPDLTIQSISVSPPNPKQGDNAEFAVTVKNIGKGTAKKSTTLIYLINGDKQTLLFLDFPSCPPLNQGATHTYTKKAKIEDCGEYRYRAFVDVSKEVDESNEENNRIVKSFTVPCAPEEKPDLTVQSITLSPSSPAQEGTITFTVKIENKGAGDAGGFYVYYYIDGSNVDSDHISSLSAGATSTQTFTWTANKCGNLQVKALADATNAVDESNEDNNERTNAIHIRCPDLKVESVTYSPKKVLQGTMITVTAKIKNIGDADAEESNTNIEFTDSAGQSKGGEVVKIGALSVGEETTIEKNYLMQQTGKRILSVEANYDKAVKESDYSNNKKKVTIEVIGISISVKVYNVNNGKLWWDGKINVRAYDENNKRVANAEKSFNNVDSVTVSLQVPSDASLIRVFQTPNIKDGVQEYWGSMYIQPTRQTTYDFTRHTSWISDDITINGHSIYSDTINLNKGGVYCITLPVTNSGYSKSSTIVEVLLDRDEKKPWDFYTSNSISINSKEEKDFHFTYVRDKETTGIWRFRAIVKEQYESEGGGIANTDQHAWYIIINKGLLDREFYLGITAQSYYAFISQDSDKALDKTIEDTIKLYNSQVIGASEDEAKKSLLQVIKKYDPVLGNLFEAYTSINDLIHFAENVQKILNNIMIATDLQLIKRTDGYSNAEQYSSDLGSCDGIQERVKCWKSGDEEAIEDMLTEESQYLSFMRGFADSARGGRITIEVRQQLDDFSNSCSEQEDEVKHLYYELVNHDLDKYNDFKVKSNWYSKANP